MTIGLGEVSRARHGGINFHTFESFLTAFFIFLMSTIEREIMGEEETSHEEEVVKVTKTLTIRNVRHFFQGLNLLAVAISIVSWIFCVFAKKKLSFTYMMDKAVGNILICGLVVWSLEYCVMKFTGNYVSIDYSNFKSLFIAMMCYYFFKTLKDYNIVFGLISFVVMVGLSALYHIDRHHDLGELLENWIIAVGPESK